MGTVIDLRTEDDNGFESEKSEKFDATLESVQSLLTLLENPQDLLHTLLLPPQEPNNGETKIDDENASHIELLRSISKRLFARLELLATLQENIDQDEVHDDAQNSTGTDSCPLSGLTELYTGDIPIDDGKIDAETIWGQVDLQNEALLANLKKSTRKLRKKCEKGDKEIIRLLDMEEEDESITDDIKEEKEESSEDESENDSDGDIEDDNTRRIRERMERAMVEMEDDVDESQVGSVDSKGQYDKESDHEEVGIDPTREEMYDGFFDLHEMERFADEEEEMLPEEAYGEPVPDMEQDSLEKRMNLPHIRDRQGNNDDDVEDDEEFNLLERKSEEIIRRRRYRDNVDIEALSTLYTDGDDEDHQHDDAVDMIASDFFGPRNEPSKEYLAKSKKECQKDNNDDDDADSWDDHDFTEEKNWRDEESHSKMNQEVDINEHEPSKGLTDEMNSENEDENKDIKPKKLSKHQENTKKLEDLTKQLEKEALAEKPWQMVGETKASTRPTNSLLDFTPEFEFATKMAPLITVEHTESIEDMIRKRILAEDWDDVVPRELPDIGLDKRNGDLPEVSQEKSKLSLGELYEREYLKKAVGYDKTAEEKESEEDKAKNEMKMLFANICSKLDALSNYHFAPRPVADEAEVKTQKTPAIAMEEVLPLHTSNAQASAPEEVYAAKKGRESILRGDSEMTQVRGRCRNFLKELH